MYQPPGRLERLWEWYRRLPKVLQALLALALLWVAYRLGRLVLSLAWALVVLAVGVLFLAAAACAGPFRH